MIFNRNQLLRFAVLFAVTVFLPGAANGSSRRGSGELYGPGASAFANPIDDPQFFVGQQYLDFLGRQPDQAGWEFWTNEITACGSDAACIEMKRINVSAAFY